VVVRAANLAVELCLAGANAVAFVALLVHGSRAGRVAWRAMVWGVWAALAAAIGTMALRPDDQWLFDAWRVTTATQALKALALLGLLLSLAATRRDTEEWSLARAVGPFFRLACVTGLDVAISAADLVVLWLALELTTIALLLAVAVGGRWAGRYAMVHRLVAVWLPTSLLLLCGIILLAAAGGTTRYVGLETTLPTFHGAAVVTVGIALIAAAVLARAGRAVRLLLARDV